MKKCVNKFLTTREAYVASLGPNNFPALERKFVKRVWQANKLKDKNAVDMLLAFRAVRKQNASNKTERTLLAQKCEALERKLEKRTEASISFTAGEVKAVEKRTSAERAEMLQQHQLKLDLLHIRQQKVTQTARLGTQKQMMRSVMMRMLKSQLSSGLSGWKEYVSEVIRQVK